MEISIRCHNARSSHSYLAMSFHFFFSSASLSHLNTTTNDIDGGANVSLRLPRHRIAAIFTHLLASISDYSTREIKVHRSCERRAAALCTANLFIGGREGSSETIIVLNPYLSLHAHKRGPLGQFVKWKVIRFDRDHDADTWGVKKLSRFLKL